jgi:hypothetical protein
MRCVNVTLRIESPKKIESMCRLCIGIPYKIRKMNRHDCLPEFFAIEESGSFKLYFNKIEQNNTSLNIPSNVLWPVDDATLGFLNSNGLRNDARGTFIRKWNGRHYRSCYWNSTNQQVEMILNGRTQTIPVLEFSNCVETILPFNSLSLKPKVVRHAPVPMAPRLPASSSMPVGRML